MYKYELCARLAYPTDDYNFKYEDKENAIDIEKVIRNAAHEFTEESKTSKNSKALEIKDISEKEIKCILYSKQPLPAPGRGLRVFSKKLIEHPYFSERIYNNGLLKFYALDISDNNVQTYLEEKEIINPDNISDSEFITSLMQYLLSTKGTYTSEQYQKKKAIDQMKVIAYKAKLLKEE